MNSGVPATKCNLRWSMCCVYTQRGNPPQRHALLKPRSCLRHTQSNGRHRRHEACHSSLC
jgi:hypothetical protein